MSKCKMFCFPFAGGSSTIYFPWKKLMNDITIECMEYKGHGMRIAEDFYGSVQEAAEDSAKIIGSKLDGDFVLFGYSFGCRVALETAYVLKRMGYRPKAIVLAGQRPPHLLWKDKKLTNGTKQEAIDHIIELGHVPQEVVECEELMELYTDIIYSDLVLNEEAVHNTYEPLDIPMFIYAGTEDDEAPEDDMKEYSKYTTNRCEVKVMEGKHFFAFDNEQVFINELKNALSTI